MANLRVIVVFILTYIMQGSCNITYGIHQIKQVTYRNIELYGEVIKEVIENYEPEDTPHYPRGDKLKVTSISKQWGDYYECLAYLSKKLTASQNLPSTILRVYTEAVARLPCNLCIAPDERGILTWTYAESTKNLTFLTLEHNDRTVKEEDGNLTIYHVTARDAGVYRCRIGDSRGGLVVLEITDDDENYAIVKPSTSRGPYASPAITHERVTVFSLWSEWSECSVCGRVGRRRRYGMCYVKLQSPATFDSTEKSVINNDYIELPDEITSPLFEAFPGGVPCRSPHLPRALRRIPAVQRRNNEIMIAMCKVKCKDTVFEMRSKTGRVLERANNTAGLYSLYQRLPKRPRVPVRDTMFAEYGRPFVIRCPGTLLRDAPVVWRVGAGRVVPRDLDEASGGRVHLNARDHLIFNQVLYQDANLYSCWIGDSLDGATKLAVWRGARARWGHRAALAQAVALAAVACHLSERVLRNRMRRRN